MSDQITITGNVAGDPERRQTPSGTAVATFRMASSQRHFDRARGEWVETGTNWYSVSAFRALAEHVIDSLHKGERIIVTGRLRLREWETTSKRGLSVEIDADAIGHDLRWGTTRYRRATPGGAPPSAEHASDPSAATASDAWATATPGDWGAPAHPTAPAEGSSPASRPEHREATPAAVGSTAASRSERPF